MKTLNIDGQQYNVVKTTFCAEFSNTLLKLQKPRGKRFYSAVVYKNGSFSKVV